MKKRVLSLLLCLVAVAGLAYGAAEVISAKDWAEKYPDQYASYLKNEENKDVVDYVATYPQIAILYEGVGFGKDYYSPRGHNYSLEDVENIGRPHPLANCLTCKTPDYTALVNEMGEAAYTLDFNETLAQMNEPISCFNCHGNDVPTLQVTHGYFHDAIGDADIPAATLSCGQCHNEYHFPEPAKATTLPYESLEGIAPDKIYQYYQDKNYTDYTNPRTGTNFVKVQHPEFETFMGQGSVHKSMFSCASCHMAKETNDQGAAYTSHYWISPLKEPAISATCAGCHQDLPGFVTGIQERVDGRTVQVADTLVELTEALAKKVADGATDEELADVRALNREAQFFWDFVFVENSEGAHNSKLSTHLLDKAEALAQAALGLLK